MGRRPLLQPAQHSQRIFSLIRQRILDGYGAFAQNRADHKTVSFHLLQTMRGVTGAKRLIAAGPVRCVANPLAAIDIDTEADVTAHLQVRVSDMAD